MLNFTEQLCFHLSGTAYIHGMKHATGNFIFIMDADLSHHVSGASKHNYSHNVLMIFISLQNHSYMQL